ncbi:MAG: lysine--tRNA ligase [Deltaproteobacteria bacterium]|nr:lysine--tRNA ligase [Deltaproteobacteria bacterium]
MSSRESPEQPETTLDRIMGERRDKATALRTAGSDPYRNDIGPAISIAAVRAKYAATKPVPPPPPEAKVEPKVEATPGAPKVKAPPEAITPIDGTPLRVAGRVMVKRGMGKTVFAPIRDTTGDLQLYLNVDHLAADDFANVLSQLDAGDIVAAEGPAFWTKRGELSILASRLWILTKSLRPLPDKWHGLTDVEQRYRQRYVDLAVSPDVREVFRKRSMITRGIRRFLDERGYLEVETPMMHPIIGGAAAKPFVTHHNALDMRLYMRIAPELYLKRLVVGGFDRVYEINRNFRNEGLSRQHNPEFTMLEFYQAYATYTDLMDLTEAMVGELAMAVNGRTKATWDGVEIELAPPWRRLSIRDAVRELGGIAEATRVFEDPAFAAEIAITHGVPAADVARVMLAGVTSDRGGNLVLADVVAGFKDPARRAALAGSIVERYDSPMQRRITAGHLGYLVFEVTAEKQVVQPTFLTEFPLAVSPLARKNDVDGAFCDRFELYCNGREIANGFSELNDPDDQRSRFAAQMRAKQAGADETMDYDEDYCRALEVGLPPTAGEGIGIDRLAMLLTGQPSIRDVILFPLMRPE